MSGPVILRLGSPPWDFALQGYSSEAMAAKECGGCNHKQSHRVGINGKV
jgi:hypothetical protein